LDLTRPFIGCLLLWLPLACCSGVRPLVVVGTSMEPTLMSGQLVLLHEDYYRTHTLERGQLVAFRWRGRVYVKRVHALEREDVLLIRVPGYSIPVAPGIEAKARRLGRCKAGFRFCRVTVPPGCFFSLGDHATASVDSRDLGPIPVSAIIGRVQPVGEEVGRSEGHDGD
jgi:signal peptidase I